MSAGICSVEPCMLHDEEPPSAGHPGSHCPALAIAMAGQTFLWESIRWGVRLVRPSSPLAVVTPYMLVVIVYMEVGRSPVL